MNPGALGWIPDLAWPLLSSPSSAANAANERESTHENTTLDSGCGRAGYDGLWR